MRSYAFITAIPIVLVNAVAFGGQYAYIRGHVHWITPAQFIFALALESIALFLTYMAHQALMAEDSAYGLRALAYAFGFIIGAMNYTHYAGTGMHPTFEAVATGLMSTASPLLWGIYTKRRSRDVLKAKGLIEPRAVKLGALRWLLWFRSSAAVFRRAVWAGENRPSVAIAGWEAEPVAAELPPVDLGLLANVSTKAEAVRVALAALGESVTASMVAQWLADRGWEVTPAHVRAIKAQPRKVTT